MTNNQKYDIFISYSHKDIAIVDRICNAFKDVKISYFINSRGVSQLCEDYLFKIENSRLFIFIASENYYKSKTAIKELLYIIDKKLSNSIIPYIVDNSELPDKIRIKLSNINCRTITKHPIETSFIGDVLELLGRERVVVNVKQTPQLQNEDIVPTTIFTKRDIHLLNLPDDEFIPFQEYNNYGLKLKSSNEVIILPKYHHIDSFHEGMAIVHILGKGLGFINKTGKEIITCKYGSAYPFNEGLAAVSKDNKFGFINQTGEEIINFKYDYSSYYCFNEGLAVVKFNNKWGIINKIGQEIVPHIYEDIYSNNFKECLVAVKLNNKWGFIDRNGKEVIPCIYDDEPLFTNNHYFFNDGLASVRLNNKWGIIDMTGKIVVPFKYDYIAPFKEGLASVTIHKRGCGFIDKTGKEVIPCIYSSSSSFDNGKAYVTKKSFLFFSSSLYIDKYGNKIK